MSNSDDKKGSGTDDQKSPGSKPVKRTRNRKASRPPTIEVEAVRLDAETTAKSEPESGRQDKVKPQATKKASEKADANAKAEFNRPDPGIGMLTDGSGQFTYRDMALSAGVGAVVSIVLFAGVFGISFFSSGQNDVEDRIAALSGEVSGLSAAVENTTAGQDTIKILQRQVEQLVNRPEVSQLVKISAQIKAIETALANPPEPAVDAAELKGLVERIDALDVKTAEAKSAAEKSIRRAGILEQAVKAADETIKGTTDGTQGSLVAQNLRLADVEASIGQLSGNLEEMQGKLSSSTRVAGLEKNVTSLRKAVDDLANRFSTLNDLAARLSTAQASSAAVTSNIDARLARLEQVDRSDSSSRLAALSFAIENLAQKIESGEVFTREIKIVSAALPENSQLDKLNSLASSGVKSIAQLQREFPPVLRAVLAAEDTEVASGVMGKLVGTAKSLIRIRRVGEVEGESREAVIARLETRVRAGNLDAALIEAKKLEGASASAIAGWVQSVEERMKAIKLINNLRNDVITGLEPK